MIFKNILVVCMGNICRSPIAEHLLKVRVADDISVSSAGLGALVNYPADENAIAVMAEHGYDITEHRARQISPELVMEHDLILVMTEEQKHEVEEICHAARGRVYRLGEWSDREVDDPYHMDADFFKKTYELIDSCVNEWVPRLSK